MKLLKTFRSLKHLNTLLLKFIILYFNVEISYTMWNRLKVIRLYYIRISSFSTNIFIEKEFTLSFSVLYSHNSKEKEILEVFGELTISQDNDFEYCRVKS